MKNNAKNEKTFDDILINGKIGKKLSFVLSHQKLIYSLLLGIIMVLYSSIYFSNTFPLSEGWNVNYAELVLHGKLPYKDFYYYLPPLNIAIDIILWSLSFGSLFLYRVWWLCQRILIFELIFFLLCRYFKPTAAFLGCAFGSILATASVYDLFGDYNQTIVLLSVILVYVAVGFSKEEQIKKKCKKMIIAGAMIALIFLSKQTIFLSTVLVYFSVLAVSSVILRDKNFWKYLLSASVGFVLVVAPVIILMLCTGTFVPFVDQVFLSTGGKGSLYEIIVERLIRKLFLFVPWLLTGLIMLIKKVTDKRENVKHFEIARGLFVVLIIVLGVVCGARIQSLISGIEVSWKFQAVVLIGAIPLACVIIFRLTERGLPRFRTNKIIFAATAFWSAFTLLVGYLVDSEKATDIFFAEQNDSFVQSGSTYVMKSIYSSGDTFSLVTETLYTVILCFVILSLVCCICKQKENQSTKQESRQLVWIACGAFSLMYASLMASGGEIGFHAIMIALPFILCKAFSLLLNDKLLETIMRSATLVLCTCLCFVCISQKFVAPYSWWGSGTTETKAEKIYETNIPALKGFTFSEETKNKYEEITRIILENTDEDDVVYGFPYLKIFNVITNRYNYDTFVPVMFYDVVGDKYVEYENELLKQNLPDILLIHSIPDCMETHEEVYRDGEPLVQRETLEYFKTVIPEKYILLGIFDDVSVYKLVS